MRETQATLVAQRKWLDYYGGAVYHERNANKLIKGITAREHALYVPALLDSGQVFSVKYLWPQVLQTNFFKTAAQLQVPVYFFTGRHDYNVMQSLTEKYYYQLQAPHKELIWFENSAHWIPFEEPEKFNRLVVEKLLKDQGTVCSNCL